MRRLDKTALFILVDPLQKAWQFGTDDDYEATWCDEPYGYACTIAYSKKLETKIANTI